MNTSIYLVVDGVNNDGCIRMRSAGKGVARVLVWGGGLEGGEVSTHALLHLTA